MWDHPLIPKDILEEGLLTPCDQREIVLDRITRTSDAVSHLQVVKKWQNHKRDS